MPLFCPTFSNAIGLTGGLRRHALRACGLWMFSESVKDIGVLLETSLKDLYEKSKVGSLNIERGSLGNTQIAGGKT